MLRRAQIGGLKEIEKYSFRSTIAIPGLTQVFNRLTIVGKSTIKPHRFQSPKLIKKLLGLDVNAMYATDSSSSSSDSGLLERFFWFRYPSVIGRFLCKSVGNYSLRYKADQYRQSSVLEKGFLAHSWLLFQKEIVYKRYMRHLLEAHGEKKLYLKNGMSCFVDGWIPQDNGTGYAFEFHVSLCSRSSYSNWLASLVPSRYFRGASGTLISVSSTKACVTNRTRNVRI